MDDDVLEQRLRVLHSASFGWAMACCCYRQAEAEDVLQTVYLKIIQGRARFDGLSTFKTWLFGVIRITARESRRRSLLELSRLERFGWRQAAFSTSDSTIVETEAKFENLRAALKTLPGRQREVLELVFYHGLSIEEAAAIMQVAIGTARTHYERGKQALRHKLKMETEHGARTK